MLFMFYCEMILFVHTIVLFLITVEILGYSFYVQRFWVINKINFEPQTITCV